MGGDGSQTHSGRQSLYDRGSGESCNIVSSLSLGSRKFWAEREVRAERGVRAGLANVRKVLGR